MPWNELVGNPSHSVPTSGNVSKLHAGYFTKALGKSITLVPPVIEETR